MFDLHNSEGSYKNNSESDLQNIKSEFLKFSVNTKKDDFLENLAIENKFIQDEIKIRSTVVDMLDKEFGKNIRNIKDYEFLVDSVICKLKKNQTGDDSCI